MAGPRSVRFEPSTDAHLASFVSRHPGLSYSSAAALLVEEGLRMDAHPGVIFREGPAGRRAVIAGGPDVWEVVRAIQLTRAAEPKLSSDDVLQTVTENTGVSDKHLQLAIAYYANYPDEVDAILADADQAEVEAAAAVARRHALLGA
jgi:hypothetical protein